VSNFEIIEGDPRSSTLLHVPHASRVIPADVRSALLLTDEELEVELNELVDVHTDQLALAAAGHGQIKPWLFINRISRLVVDPERFPDEREHMNALGMGAVYLSGSAGQMIRKPDPDRDRDLIARYFDPYAQAVEALALSLLAEHGRLTILDIHSYPAHAHENSINKEQRRPALCLGTDPFHTTPALVERTKAAFSDVGEIVENEPYSGTYVPLALYESDPRVSAVMLEIRRDTYSDDALHPSAGFSAIAEAIGRLI
jgi:N-formylglutamate deformylase